MDIASLGSRCVRFSFPELAVSLLAIYGQHRTYLCDTFLGPEPMELVKEAFRAEGRDQPVVVFNSHSHWDHVWGNCAFPGSLVLAHELCRARLERDFGNEFEAYRGQAKGVVAPRFPDLVFWNKVAFPDDGVEFYHTPGHTPDSASCLDLKDNVLFVGDNVEEPIPHVEDPDLGAYIATLEGYLCLNPAAYVAGHGPRFPRDLIEANLAYLRRLAAGKAVDTSGWTEAHKRQHQENLEVLRMGRDAG